jgi:hypothetical protein
MRPVRGESGPLHEDCRLFKADGSLVWQIGLIDRGSPDRSNDIGVVIARMRRGGIDSPGCRNPSSRKEMVSRGFD